ncbi:MAG: hypothetical protein IJS15_13995, partial [Victivallales bacterium]|nr:hypothetical protein [Victivallales bacterium]
SHDRYFLDRVCTHILAFEDDGTLFFTPGNYSYYAMKHRERLAAIQPVSAKPTKEAPARKEKSAQRRLKWSEKKELEGMEDAILKAEQEVADIEALFQLPDFHQKYGKQTNELMEKLEHAKAEVARLYARWEELESIKE